KHLPAIKSDAGIDLPQPESLGIFAWKKDQGVDCKRGIRAEMQAVQGFIECLGGELIERGVILILYFALVLQPKRFDFIHALSVEKDGEPDKVAVGLDQLANAALPCEFGIISLKFENDFAAAALSGSVFDLIT